MNKNDFYMVLPSNSSMDYYNDNTASRYTTLLPKQIDLDGEWVVGLSEIQFPCNFLHISNSVESSIKILNDAGDLPPVLRDIGKVYEPIICSLPNAVFRDVSDLIFTLNEAMDMKEHFKFEYSKGQGFVTIKKICTVNACGNRQHWLYLSDKLANMLGFKRGKLFFNDATPSQEGDLPSSLSRGLPDSLFVYSDICSPYVTGDVQSALLRMVPFNTSAYSYGSTHCVTFSTPHYIPLIRNSFRTIEMDIRSHLGELIPFEYGPLSVTLHFKRLY